MSDEHVSYKANWQTASTKSQATMGPPAKRFSDGVFLEGREWPDFTCLLGASRSVFESTCIYSDSDAYGSAKRAPSIRETRNINTWF